jgi:hypothetical protein
MKKIALVFSLLPLMSLCQSPNKPSSLPKLASSDEVTAANKPWLPLRDGKIFYETIDSSYRKSKIETYKSAKIWFADIFKDSKSVLQIDDKDLGELLGKGTFQYPVSSQGVVVQFWCEFTAKLSCRENRFRLQIYDIRTKGKAADNFYPADFMAFSKESVPQIAAREIDRKINEIIASAKVAIEAKIDAF